MEEERRHGAEGSRRMEIEAGCGLFRPPPSCKSSARRLHSSRLCRHQRTPALGYREP